MCIYVHPVAYLGFHFGGGSKFFWKSGVICMAKISQLPPPPRKFCNPPPPKKFLNPPDNFSTPPPPENLSTPPPENLSTPPPPENLSTPTQKKISQPPPPRKFLNPPRKFLNPSIISQPLLKISQSHSKTFQPQKYKKNSVSANISIKRKKNK